MKMKSFVNRPSRQLQTAGDFLQLLKERAFAIAVNLPTDRHTLTSVFKRFPMPAKIKVSPQIVSAWHPFWRSRFGEDNGIGNFDSYFMFPRTLLESRLVCDSIRNSTINQRTIDHRRWRTVRT